MKKLRGLHGRIAEQLNNILNKEEKLPEWLIFGRNDSVFVIAEIMYKHLEEILP